MVVPRRGAAKDIVGTGRGLRIRRKRASGRRKGRTHRKDLRRNSRRSGAAGAFGRPRRLSRGARGIGIPEDPRPVSEFPPPHGRLIFQIRSESKKRENLYFGEICSIGF